MSSPFVSVIVPVFNDPEGLVKCLQGLEEQTYPKSSYEVIVVDNGSDESIEPIVAQFGQAQAQSESRPGSYAARNKGISLAKGSVFAFIDSDCIPTPDWIEKGVAHLLRVPNCGSVSGSVEVFAQDPEHPTIVELYDSVMAFPQRRYVEEGNYGGAGNLFAFRKVFEHVGYFRPDLKSGGDFEWGQRVFSHGYKQVYADDVCVYHPARRTFEELYTKTVRVVGGAEDLKRLNLKKTRRLLGFDLKLIYGFLPPIGKAVQAWSDSRLATFGDKVKVVLVIFFVRYVKAWARLRFKLGDQPSRWR